MTRIIATYCVAILLVSLGFFGVGALAAETELRDPMQPPPFALKKFREAELADKPKPAKAAKPAPQPEPLRLTSIIYSEQRKVAIIDDQMLAVGDRIGDAKLVELTRDSARLVRKGKVIKLSLGTDLTVVRKQAVKSDL